MSKRLKALVVKELTDEFRGLDRCVVVGLTGIPAGDANSIRAKLESKNMRLRVVKNTLAAVALKELGLAGVEKHLVGPSALVTGGTDIVDLAKTADELAKSRDGVTVKGGFGEGKVLSSQEIAALSKLPSREEMLATLAGAMASSMSNFAGVLGAAQRKFLYALVALKEQKAGAAA